MKYYKTIGYAKVMGREIFYYAIKDTKCWWWIPSASAWVRVLFNWDGSNLNTEELIEQDTVIESSRLELLLNNIPTMEAV